MSELPEIRIRHSRLMTRSISTSLIKYHRGPDAEVSELEVYLKKADAYRDGWKVKEQAILSGMTNELGLNFYLPVIDATLAPMVPTFSTPLTLNYRFTPDEFIDALTHELIHILLSDNIYSISFEHLKMEQWPNENDKTRNHILVHAVLAFIDTETLAEPARMERDSMSCHDNPPYRRAWEIVKEQGYRPVIELIKAEVMKSRS